MKLKLASLLLLALPAYSAIVITLTPATQFGAPGNDVIFSGTLENNGLAEVFLNGLEINFTPPAGTYLTADPNFFFANVIGSLLPGETYTGPLFLLTLAAGTPPGAYLGTATVLGGDSEIVSVDPVASSDFTVTVTPEPATWGLLASAGAALALRRRR